MANETNEEPIAQEQKEEKGTPERVEGTLKLKKEKLPPQQFSLNEVEDMIKHRLRSKESENEALREQVEALKNSMLPEEQLPTETNKVPENAALTREDIQDLLTNQHNQLFTQLALNKTQDNWEKMRDEDEEFRKLSEDGRKIPDEIKVHINNSLDYKRAKGVFKEVMNNENTYLKMMLAGMLGEKSFNEWLGQQVQNKPNLPEAPKNVPDLSKESGSNTEPSMENVLNYIRDTA